MAQAAKSSNNRPIIIEVSHESVLLSWEKPLRRGKVDYYEIKYKKVSETKWETFRTQDDKSTATVTGLKCSKKYHFKVRAVYNDEEGPCTEISEAVEIRSPPYIRNTPGSHRRANMAQAAKSSNNRPIIIEVSDESVLLSWEKPLRTEKVDYYEIRYKEVSATRWETFSTQDDKSTATVTGLKCSKKYHFKVRAVYNDEEGPCTEISEAVEIRSPPYIRNTPGSHESASMAQAAKSSNNRPIIIEVSDESVLLSWEKPLRTERVGKYEIRYKEVSATEWETFRTQDDKSTATVTGLKCSKKYHFKVRAVYNDEEGPYTEISEAAEIRTTLAKKIVENKKLISLEGTPRQLKIPITSTVTNQSAKTRKCVVDSGQPRALHATEKTIILVGATGAGKSTLLDGMINFITNVAFNDDFRFTVVDLMKDEKKKTNDKTVSQTEWITYYKIHQMDGANVKFTLNIIDTPGFGDTRGIKGDKLLVEQIRQFFCTKGDVGINSIDAVCFVTPAPLIRLTPTQRYIFDSILSIFGKDIASNIVIMVTFADGNKPPVLHALQHGKVPFKEHFVFNNSALFATQTEKFAQLFWNMGRESFKIFFDHLQGMEERSLTLTAEVLRERKQLEETVNGLLPHVNKGLNKMAEIKGLEGILSQHKLEMEANKNFTFKAKRTIDKKIDLEDGTYVTNCIYCHQTCHYPCYIPFDKDKASCAAITDGSCTVCKNKCVWSKHQNNGCRFVSYEEEYEGTYYELLKKYKVAKNSVGQTESLIKRIENEMTTIGTDVQRMISDINRCLNRLKEIALKKDPLNDVQYIELLIESEKTKAEPGFQARIRFLEDIKEKATLTAEVQKGTYKPFRF